MFTNYLLRDLNSLIFISPSSTVLPTGSLGSGCYFIIIYYDDDGCYLLYDYSVYTNVLHLQD